MRYKYAHGITSGDSDTTREPESRGRVEIVDRNGVAVFVLVDPSAARNVSALQSKQMAEAASALMTERFDEMFAAREDSISKAFQAQAEDKVKAWRHRSSDPEVSLLFVAVKENRYLAAHMRDGLIVRYDGSGSILSGPEMGGRGGKLRVYKGMLQEPFGFMLMTRGACRSLYETGADSLSPACGTFFEWLREHDEETVSEALVENIRKYFIKDTETDIGVALMISAGNETVAKTVVPETGVPERAHGKFGNIVKYIIAIGIVAILAAAFIFAMKQPGTADTGSMVNGDGHPAANSSENGDPPINSAEKGSQPIKYSVEYQPAITFAVENPESYDAGRYKIGVDIPAGEYFFWTGEMLKPDSIIVNDDTCLSGELYCMTVRVNDYDVLETEYRFTAAENLDPVKATKGILLSGKYKIGKDIAPGMYTVKPVSRDVAGRYYSVLDEEISNNIKFTEDTLVEVPEEGYIVFYNSVLAVEE